MARAEKKSDPPMIYDLIIIGAGAYGLSTAYYLSQSDQTLSVLVLSDRHPFESSSLQNGWGLRCQWGHEVNIRLCQSSKSLLQELDRNLESAKVFDSKGYLLLGHESEKRDLFEQASQHQRRFGVPAQTLEASEVCALAPNINKKYYSFANYSSEDGCLNGHLLLQFLLDKLNKSEQPYRFDCLVKTIQRPSSEFLVTGQTEKGEELKAMAKRVLVATDGQLNSIEMDGWVPPPIHHAPAELFEFSVDDWICHPAVISYRLGYFINQVSRNKIRVVTGRREGSLATFSELEDKAKVCAENLKDFFGCKMTNEFKMTASTSRLVSCTPDMQAVVGESSVPGLYFACSAYKGLMTSLAVGQLLSKLLTQNLTSDELELLDLLSPTRFQLGRLIPEPYTL